MRPKPLDLWLDPCPFRKVGGHHWGVGSLGLGSLCAHIWMYMNNSWPCPRPQSCVCMHGGGACVIVCIPMYKHFDVELVARYQCVHANVGLATQLYVHTCKTIV